MDLYALNRLIERISTLKRQVSMNEADPFALENLKSDINLLNRQYGIYLNELLFDAYDEYCEDNEIQNIEDYLSPEGVAVEVDDFPGIKYSLKLKAFPLRLELENAENHEVIWRAA